MAVNDLIFRDLTLKLCAITRFDLEAPCHLEILPSSSVSLRDLTSRSCEPVCQ